MRSATIMNDLPTPLWIALMLLGFVLFWPLGLFVLIYLIWSQKMMCCTGRRNHLKSDAAKPWSLPFGAPRTTGNVAFDEYREATLKRLSNHFLARSFVAGGSVRQEDGQAGQADWFRCGYVRFQTPVSDRRRCALRIWIGRRSCRHS